MGRFHKLVLSVQMRLRSRRPGTCEQCQYYRRRYVDMRSIVAPKAFRYYGDGVCYRSGWPRYRKGCDYCHRWQRESEEIEALKGLYQRQQKVLDAINKWDEAGREAERRAEASKRRRQRLAVIFVVVGVLVNSAVLTFIWWLLRHG